MRYLIVLILGILLGFSTFQSDAKPRKLALIIAVADYPKGGGWPAISSDHDVALVRDALLKQGFDDKNIAVVMDQMADKEGFVKAINNLIASANKGDIVVVHYSGHGQQIFDDNGDEIDGYDESLIPYDAGLRFIKGVYQGERHLRDDEFGALMSQLREKLGPEGNLLVILDSCHSGTGTRGLRPCRGTEIKMQPDDYQPQVKTGYDEGFFEGSDSRGIDTEMAPMVVFSGASQDELNYEYVDEATNMSYGSLSWAFSKNLSEADNNMTYRALFDKILVDMSNIAPRQTPQIEGDVDYKILGGEAVKQQPYFRVKEWFDQKTITLEAGTLMGLYDNSIVSLYPVNTADPKQAKSLATGTVANATLTTCDILLDKPLDEKTARSSWVFITKQNFGDMRVKVKIDVSKDRNFAEKLSQGLSAVPTVQLVSQAPDLLIEMNDKTRGNSLQAITSDEFPVFTLEVKSGNETEVRSVVDRVKDYAQASLLRKIELSDPDLDISFQIVPVTVKRMGSKWIVDQQIPIESKMSRGNQLEFKDGDCFTLVITNNGNMPAYYQILDIRPDDSVSLLIPSENRTASEYNLRPGESKELKDIFVFGKPYGTEIFKLIATKEVLNLQGIVTTRGEETNPNPSPFELLFSESYNQTRAGTLSVAPGSANVFTIPLKIVQ